MPYAEQLRFEGKNEGRSEATRAVAIRLLLQNLDPAVVATGTALPLAQVLTLKKKLDLSRKKFGYLPQYSPAV